MSQPEDQHTSIFAVDVERYGDVRRTDRHQKVVRDGLYAALHHAFDRAGVPWGYHEDRGDGLFALLTDVAKSELVASLPHELAAALREHNADHGPETQIRLKVAIHAGEVGTDDNGKHGTDLNHAFRLLDCDPLRDALSASPGVLALAVSDWFYEHVVKHQPAANPGIYKPSAVRQKETATTAWICTPDYPAAPRSTRKRSIPRPVIRIPQLKLPTPHMSKPRWELVVLTVFLLLVPMTDILAGATPPETKCANPVQLNVLTSTEMAPALRQLALDFEHEEIRDNDSGCRPARLLVVADTYDGAVDALGRGWSGRDDLRDHGPEPHVWVPDSTADIDHVRERLTASSEVDLEPRPGIAQSPLVLAIPPDMANYLRPDQQRFSWDVIAHHSRDVGFIRPDPRTSSAGLLGTIAIYQHRLGNSQLTSTTFAMPTTPRVVHEAEDDMPYAAGMDSGDLLCQLRNNPQQLRAALVSEKAVIDYNRGAQLGSHCSTTSTPPTALDPLYPRLGTPVQDYPFVVVRWTDRPENRQRAAVIDRFYDYLRGRQSAETLRFNGFRDPQGHVGRFDGPIPELPTALQITPDSAFDQVQAAATSGSKHARVLFAVDTSATMGTPFGSGTRLQASTELVRRLTALFNPTDDVGLLTFSDTERDLVPLSPGQANAVRLAARVDLPASKTKADVYNAVRAGVSRLRTASSATSSSLLVLITDGATADVSQTDLPTLQTDIAAPTDQATKVLAVSVQTARCHATGLDAVARGTGGDCVDLTDLDQGITAVLDQVAGQLWGTQ
ncbi:vWA domain-containing protein [Actinokineospora inagensis]|uniref:vWA domain-containing protein n=1 Tax=Actinokineospora inagensis TaxID=103730 RepID=UPI0004005CC4|nr:substrate-binding domain-containing protein [Actinokineospora inagensis]